jgi:hypothetical protein
MKKVTMLTVAVLLVGGVAFAEEQVMQQSKEVKEKTAHSTSVSPDYPGQPATHEHESTKVEKHQQTTTGNPDSVVSPETAQKNVEVKKKSSTTVTTEGAGNPLSDSETRSSVESHSHSKQTSTSVTHD